jgi:hypothetical protein
VYRPPPELLPQPKRRRAVRLPARQRQPEQEPQARQPERANMTGADLLHFHFVPNTIYTDFKFTHHDYLRLKLWIDLLFSAGLAPFRFAGRCTPQRTDHDSVG